MRVGQTLRAQPVTLPMVFELGRAMRKKEEFESARLVDFEFRRRARPARILAHDLGLDDGTVAGIATMHDEDAIPGLLATLAGQPVAEVVAAYSKCLRQGHEQLLIERGDPTPHRMG
ncbi:hypothetical protein [uncultured Sphingomonas sp.]|uniref:hypothetical protein n=1 Tax=uncultured Sphingomonas sp. TaxID=158754 RepID=UPI0025F3C061|nr:hypothetical protein [uncultured Sphingomonas sp.]